MKKILFVLIGLAALYLVVVFSGVPQKLMQQGYQKCIGNDVTPQRAAYCGCVRDKMGAWGLRDYAGVAFQLAQSKRSGTPPAAITDLSAACVAEVSR